MHIPHRYLHSGCSITNTSPASGHSVSTATISKTGITVQTQHWCSTKMNNHPFYNPPPITPQHTRGTTIQFSRNFTHTVCPANVSPHQEPIELRVWRKEHMQVWAYVVWEKKSSPGIGPYFTLSIFTGFQWQCQCQVRRYQALDVNDWKSHKQREPMLWEQCNTHRSVKWAFCVFIEHFTAVL